MYAHTFKVHRHYVQWQLPPSVAPPQDLQSLIPTLPPWEQQLLQGLALQVSLPDLFSHLQSPILVASDGSVNEHRSSFGWVLANRDGLRLLSSRGPSPGAKPTSYRAEGVGVLSVLRCFYHLQWLHNISISGTLLCDNKQKHELKGLKHMLISRISILTPPWNQIGMSLQKSGTPPKPAPCLIICPLFTSKQGHADKDKKYDALLTLRQQLNVDADHLAAGYIERHWDDD